MSSKQFRPPEKLPFDAPTVPVEVGGGLNAIIIGRGL